MTQEEIVARIRSRTGDDAFGFEANEYLVRLDYVNAKEFIKVEVTEEQWNGEKQSNDREAILKIAEDYLTFAYEKARNQRGISANRSIMHYIAWIWLSGDVEFAEEIEKRYMNTYCEYGIPILNVICEHYKWAVPA